VNCGAGGNLRADGSSALLLSWRIIPKNAHSYCVTVFHRRRLPHYHLVGQPTFLTWRLHGSLPLNRPFPTRMIAGRAFLALDRLLDQASTGPVFLRHAAIASIVANAIRYREDSLHHYRLHACVIMPNHVHLLITPLIPIPKLMQSLKSFTGAEANRILGRGGQSFWQPESYDRLTRNQHEFHRIAHYIEMNPVKAGLAAVPESFPWSSAYGRALIGLQLATSANFN
jgi:putative transposase